MSVYNLNKSKLQDMITISDSGDYLFHGKDVGDKWLGKMLNNKVDIAYNMLMSNEEYEVPAYIKEALEWVKK